jgi:Rhodanese-related sulfurtransferase
MLNPLLPPVIEPVELHQYLDARASALAYNTQALPPICIIDLSSEQSYRAGHIPNAVYLPPTALLSGRPPAPGKIPPLAQLEQVFGYLGLTSNTHFIVYDDEGGGWAGRFIWTLDVIGHPHYSYVNGGLLAWKKNALAVEQHEHRASATSPALNIHSGVIAEIPDILAELNNNNARIWDARSPEEFRGEKSFCT